MFFMNEGFTFRNFLVDAFAIFMFVVWFWLLITVFGDLFRRHDVSGLVKVIWVISLLVLPYLSIFVYLLTQGSGMAQRTQERMKAAQDEFRRVVGFSPGDELIKLNQLKASGDISPDEYARLRARIVQ